MLYLSDSTPFRVVSVGVGRAVVAVPKNLEKTPELIVDLELKLHRIFPVRRLPLPHYEPASIRFTPPKPERRKGCVLLEPARDGNYQYVITW